MEFILKKSNISLIVRLIQRIFIVVSKIEFEPRSVILSLNRATL